MDSLILEEYLKDHNKSDLFYDVDGIYRYLKEILDEKDASDLDDKLRNAGLFFEEILDRVENLMLDSLPSIPELELDDKDLCYAIMDSLDEKELCKTYSYRENLLEIKDLEIAVHAVDVNGLFIQAFEKYEVKNNLKKDLNKDKVTKTIDELIKALVSVTDIATRLVDEWEAK